MVMDLVTGGELFDAVAEEGRLSEATTRLYFQQLVDGIHYCHTRRVYHRDLKPENLLLSGDKKSLKITDFGLSSIKAEGASSELLHTIMGSPHYIAPEILTSAAQGYDGSKVDVWASGIILFGMLAGFLPFDEPDTRALYKAIVQSTVQYPPHFSYDVIKLLRAMLQKDPARRPTMESVKDFPWFKVNYEPASSSDAKENTAEATQKKKSRLKLRRPTHRSGRTKKKGLALQLHSSASASSKEDAVEDQTRRKLTIGTPSRSNQHITFSSNLEQEKSKNAREEKAEHPIPYLSFSKGNFKPTSSSSSSSAPVTASSSKSSLQRVTAQQSDHSMTKSVATSSSFTSQRSNLLIDIDQYIDNPEMAPLSPQQPFQSETPKSRKSSSNGTGAPFSAIHGTLLSERIKNNYTGQSLTKQGTPTHRQEQQFEGEPRKLGGEYTSDAFVSPVSLNFKTAYVGMRDAGPTDNHEGGVNSRMASFDGYTTERKICTPRTAQPCSNNIVNEDCLAEVTEEVTPTNQEISSGIFKPVRSTFAELAKAQTPTIAKTMLSPSVLCPEMEGLEGTAECYIDSVEVFADVESEEKKGLSGSAMKAGQRGKNMQFENRQVMKHHECSNVTCSDGEDAKSIFSPLNSKFGVAVSCSNKEGSIE